MAIPIRNRKVYRYPYEVFEKCSEFNSFHDRVEYLKSEDSFSVKTILQANFNPHILFDLPDGVPPYTPDDKPGDQTLGRLDKLIKVLPRLIVEGKPSVGLVKINKENKFIQLLEAINAKDALVIIAMKDKKLTDLFPVIDYTLAKAAFPDIIP